jgi:hypothetical protein
VPHLEGAREDVVRLRDPRQAQHNGAETADLLRHRNRALIPRDGLVALAAILDQGQPLPFGITKETINLTLQKEY